MSRAKEHKDYPPVDDIGDIVVQDPKEESENIKQETPTEETDVENNIKDGDVDKVD